MVLVVKNSSAQVSWVQRECVCSVEICKTAGLTAVKIELFLNNPHIMNFSGRLMT